MDPREAQIDVNIYEAGRSVGFPIRMSRLEFEALKLRAAQQKSEEANEYDRARAQVTLNGHAYSEEYLNWVLRWGRSGKLPSEKEWLEARERQRQAEEKRRYEEQRRREQARSQGFIFTDHGGNTYSFTNQAEWDRLREAFGQFNDGLYRPRPGQKEESGLSPKFKKLAELAGVEWKDAIQMKAGDLRKKAMRKCHPDTGGSHAQWIELTRVLDSVGMPL